MGYQIDPVGAYWLLEDMVEDAAVVHMLHMLTPICVPAGTLGITLENR